MKVSYLEHVSVVEEPLQQLGDGVDERLAGVAPDRVLLVDGVGQAETE